MMGWTKTLGFLNFALLIYAKMYAVTCFCICTVLYLVPSPPSLQEARSSRQAVIVNTNFLVMISLEPIGQVVLLSQQMSHIGCEWVVSIYLCRLVLLMTSTHPGPYRVP